MSVGVCKDVPVYAVMCVVMSSGDNRCPLCAMREMCVMR